MSQSKACAVYLIFIYTLPVITVGQEISRASLRDMMERVQQLESQMEVQQEQVNFASHECGEEPCSAGCDASVDGDCCSTVEHCCFGEIYAFYENVIIQPFFTRNSAYYLEDPSGVEGYQEVPFDWNFSNSPRIEFGYLCDCGNLGARIRYWHFDDDTNLDSDHPNGGIFASFADDNITSIGMGSATSALFSHSRKMDILDLEAGFRQCNWTYSGGLRYARIE